jgi:hypothetical protein
MDIKVRTMDERLAEAGAQLAEMQERDRRALLAADIRRKGNRNREPVKLWGHDDNYPLAVGVVAAIETDVVQIVGGAPVLWEDIQRVERAPSNAERAERAFRAVLNYDGDDVERSICALLDDLRLLCAESGYDVPGLDG